MSHRALWKPLLSQLAPTITMGIGIITSMFFFTYLPQAAVLALFNGPLAAVSAALLVLSESSTIFMALAKSMLIEGSLVDTFDGVSSAPKSNGHLPRRTNRIRDLDQRRR